MDDKEILLQRIHPKFWPALEGRNPKDQEAIVRYFFSQNSAGELLEPVRPGIIKWYCPFAHQHHFPSGHRYCINVYVGCNHNCTYCYVPGYMFNTETAKTKAKFEALMEKDLADLDRFDVPPAPIHLSNSTDPFNNEMETKFRHTKIALEKILAHRNRFTSITILTKNPLFPVRPEGYINLFRSLMKTSSVSDPENPSFRAQVSLAFRNEASARFYEGNAPSVASRMEGITALREAGIPVTLRIDPLFVRSPLPVFPEMNLSDFGLIEAQSIDDLQNLVEFGKKVGVESIVYSPLKIVQPRGKQLNSVMQAMLQVYRQICYPGKPDWNGGSWRLPRKIAHELLVDPFLEICRQAGVKTRFCMQDLIQNR